MNLIKKCFLNRTLYQFSMLVLLVCGIWIPAASATSYYVDCSTPNNTGDGLSMSSPWYSLDEVNSHGPFQPGDKILLNTNMTCWGALTPQGSGSPGNPITLSEYTYNNSGSQRPIIDGNAADVALELNNQHDWYISDLEVRDGFYRNIWITANGSGTYSNFTVYRVSVHDNAFDPASGDWVVGSGGLIVEPCSLSTTIDNVSLNDITSYNNHESGIQVGHNEKPAWKTGDAAGGYDAPGCTMGSNPTTIGQGVTGATVENSTSYDNEADGLEVFFATTVLIYNNTFYNNGGSQYASDQNGEGAWWTSTVNTTAQYNNSYLNKRGSSGDGGGLDIDDQNIGSIVEYNWLHDNDGYGASVISTSTTYPTTNSIIRYNIMTNNGTNFGQPNGGPGVYLGTQYGGTIDGVQVYNNTISSTTGSPGMFNNAPFAGTNLNFFSNNLIYRSVASQMVYTTNNSVASSNNTYYTTATGSGAESYYYKGTSYSSLSAYQTACDCEINSSTSNPGLNNPSYDLTGTPSQPADYTLGIGSPEISTGAIISGNGGIDFFKNAVNEQYQPNVGAYNGSGTNP